MPRFEVDGVAIEFELLGAGPDLLLIHAGCFGSEWFDPLLDEGTLVRSYRVVRYDRAGYGASSRPEGPVSIADHAEHARLLLQHVGIRRAHVVGHSSSAMMALQLALDDPDRVRTLALLESARPAPVSEIQAEFTRSVVQPSVGHYRAGEAAAAVDVWLRGTCGSGYADVVARALPAGTVAKAVEGAATFFGQELPAVQAWTFGPDEAARISRPVLLVLGERSEPTFRERRQLLLEWLPQAEAFDLRSATHLLHVEQPGEFAAALMAFHGRHPTEQSA